jgi:nickel transport protein
MKFSFPLMPSRYLCGTIAVCVMLALAVPAQAHDVWLTFTGDAAQHRIVLNYGHPDDRPPAFSDKLLDLDTITASGRTSHLQGMTPAVVDGAFVAQTQPFADDGHTLVAARYDNGFWARLADGTTRNVTGRLVQNPSATLWSGKFAKAVSGPGAPWQTVLGHDLEIVPLADPGALKPGDTLRLRVLFQGKPLAGAQVERGDGKTAVPEADIPRFTTDADGVAAVPVITAGPQLLVIDHDVKPAAASAQSTIDLYNATLWFNVAG